PLTMSRSLSCPTCTPPMSSALSLHDALPISDGLHKIEGGIAWWLCNGNNALRTFTLKQQEQHHTCQRNVVGPGKRFMLHQHPELDRKSTRLNSSHVKISYAVFCLKKKRTA